MDRAGADVTVLRPVADRSGRRAARPRCTSPSTATLAAVVTVADTVKPESAEAVAQLRRSGWRCG